MQRRLGRLLLTEQFGSVVVFHQSNALDAIAWKVFAAVLGVGGVGRWKY
jgi:tRNA A37 threonylcarbamoyladenosine dehydratase